MRGRLALKEEEKERAPELAEVLRAVRCRAGVWREAPAAVTAKHLRRRHASALALQGLGGCAVTPLAHQCKLLLPSSCPTQARDARRAVGMVTEASKEGPSSSKRGSPPKRFSRRGCARHGEEQ